MKISASLSFIFHVALILIAWLGLPSAKPLLNPEQIINVEIVQELEAPEDKPKPPRKVAALPPKPPPPPPLPKPEPKPEPVAEKAPAPEPVPEPEAVPIPKPKPKPVVKEIEKPEPPKAKPLPRPKVKPKPPPKVAAKPKPAPKKEKPKEDDFASVLKTVEKLESRAKPQKKVEKKDPDEFKKIAKLLDRQPRREERQSTLDAALSQSELDAVRRQIEQCWSLPAGARDAQNMVLEIRTVLNRDGRVRSAQIVDTQRVSRDPFFRAMAESALRAVLNPQCQPLRLPPEKYDEWQIMVLVFDPRGMF